MKENERDYCKTASMILEEKKMNSRRNKINGF